jgi:hypothetical protein
MPMPMPMPATALPALAEAAPASTASSDTIGLATGVQAALLPCIHLAVHKAASWGNVAGSAAQAYNADGMTVAFKLHDPGDYGCRCRPGTQVTFYCCAGGAQDIENFRKNIEANYLPLPTDLKFEGLAKDYYFDTYG